MLKKEFVDFSLNDFLQNWSLCISMLTGQGSPGNPPWVPLVRGKFWQCLFWESGANWL